MKPAKKKLPKGTISAEEFRKAFTQLHDSDLWYIPITAGEGRKLTRILNDHLCSLPSCQVCKARAWFTTAWDGRIRVLPLMDRPLLK